MGFTEEDLRYAIPYSVALALTAGMLLAAPAEAALRTSATARAELRVSASLKRSFPDSRVVQCRRQGSRRPAQYRCTWRAERRPSPNRVQRCRGGRYRVRKAGRRLLLRRLVRARCSTRVEALNPDFGFNDSAVRAGRISLEDDVRLTEDLGAGLHRFGVDWRAIEYDRGQYHFEEFDPIYEAMLEKGIRPLLGVGGAPWWARDPLQVCVGNCRYVHNPRFDSDWRRVVSAIVRRYPRAVAVEVGNEPNELDFWPSGPDPGRYTTLLAETNRAVKEADPTMPVLSGGVSNRAVDGQGSVSMTNFLTAMYRFGANRHLDGLAFHAYPGGPRLEELGRTLDEITYVRDTYYPGRTLWMTEAGLSTTGRHLQLRTTEAEQAQGLVRLLQTLRLRKDIRAIIFHALVDMPLGDLSRESGFGVVRSDLRRKPAYCALARALRSRIRCTE